MTERRRALQSLIAFAGLFLASGSRIAGTAKAASDDDAFMKQAFAMKQIAIASGDQPYGAIVVKDGKVIGEGPSRVIVNQDPTAHAEMEAIRDAARTLGSRDLASCTLYATSRPCRMCETAAYWANVSFVYHGEALTERRSPGYSDC